MTWKYTDVAKMDGPVSVVKSLLDLKLVYNKATLGTTYYMTFACVFVLVLIHIRSNTKDKLFAKY